MKCFCVLCSVTINKNTIRNIKNMWFFHFIVRLRSFCCHLFPCSCHHIISRHPSQLRHSRVTTLARVFYSHPSFLPPRFHSSCNCHDDVILLRHSSWQNNDECLSVCLPLGWSSRKRASHPHNSISCRSLVTSQLSYASSLMRLGTDITQKVLDKLGSLPKELWFIGLGLTTKAYSGPTTVRQWGP